MLCIHGQHGYGQGDGAPNPVNSQNSHDEHQRSTVDYDSHRLEGFSLGQLHLDSYYQHGLAAGWDVDPAERSLPAQNFVADLDENEASDSSIFGDMESSLGDMSSSFNSIATTHDELNASTSMSQQPPKPPECFEEQVPRLLVNDQIINEDFESDKMSLLGVSLDTAIDDSIQSPSIVDAALKDCVKAGNFTEATALYTTFDDQDKKEHLEDDTLSLVTDRPGSSVQPGDESDQTQEASVPPDPSSLIEGHVIEALSDIMPVLVAETSSPIIPDDQSTEYLTKVSIESRQSDSDHEPEERDMMKEMEKGTEEPEIIFNYDPDSPSLSTEKAGHGSGSGPFIKTGQFPMLKATQNRHMPSREKDWEKIKRFRAEVWSLRSKINEMRSVLRQKQLAKSTADDNFFQFVRQQAAKDNSFRTLDEQNTMEALLGDCELARNEYGPLEDDLNLLESDLGNQEYALQKLENKLYDVQVTFKVPSSEDFDVESAQLSNGSSSSESNTSQYFHPLVTEYLSKMGDVDIFRERLDWHWDEKETLDEEKEKRLRVGLDLAPPDQEWLDNYSAAETELQAQLKQAEEEAETLRIECFSRGLVDEEGNPTDFEDRERITFLTENVDSKDKSSEYVKFPTLIPPPNGKQMTLGESGPDEELEIDRSSSITPRVRVDQWLLHQLRMSVLGVHLLAETFEIENGRSFKDRERWQEEVLAKWFVDSGDEWDQGPQTYSSEHSTPAPRAINDPPNLISLNDESTLRKYHDEFYIEPSTPLSIPLPKQIEGTVSNEWPDIILHSSRHSM